MPTEGRAMTEHRDTPRLVPIFAGQRCIGFLLNAGPPGVEAYDRNEKSLGIFADAISQLHVATT